MISHCRSLGGRKEEREREGEREKDGNSYSAKAFTKSQKNTHCRH